MNITEEQLEGLWEVYDVDGHGVINYVEFLTATTTLNKILTEESMGKMIHDADKNSDGVD